MYLIIIAPVNRFYPVIKAPDEKANSTDRFLRVSLPAAGQFCSVQTLDWLGRRGEGGEGGDMRGDSAEILFQPFLQEAIVSASGVHDVVHPA